MKPEKASQGRRLGAKPERLTIDLPLDEALRRISQAKPPSGGYRSGPSERAGAKRSGK